MWRTWRQAIKRITQEDGNLRQNLGRWKEIPANRRYAWMQDKEWVYCEKNEIRRHKITHRGRRTTTFEERSLPVEERSQWSIPTDAPQEQEIKVNQRAKIAEEDRTQITERIMIQCPQQMRHLIKISKWMTRRLYKWPLQEKNR